MSELIRSSKPTRLKPTNKRVEVAERVAFSNKILPDGSRIFKREHGMSSTVTDTTTSLTFIVPYDKCKITGLEIINAVVGDSANFKVLDTEDGQYQQSVGVLVENIEANKLLNQFAFGTYIAKDYHLKESTYDADLIKDMTLEIEYIPKDIGSREVYVNLLLHEVK